MANILFELETLRVALQSKGMSHHDIEIVVNKARNEIRDAFEYHGKDAMDQAVGAGVEKGSSEFINELYLDESRMMLATMSGNMEFSTPPYPNLHNLLKNAKPIKDGSGVYKRIPVGAPSQKPSIASSIIDAQKQIMAERHEAASSRYKSIIPRGSRGNIKTATSKQDHASQWVIPAKEANFAEDLSDINNQLDKTMDEIIKGIISSYIEGF